MSPRSSACSSCCSAASCCWPRSIPSSPHSIGRNPVRSDALLYALLGGGIALGVLEAGPLVVFGFLVLPALAALRIAPGIASAFAIAAAIAAASFLGGFAIAYQADLPAGPVAVALAAGIWLAIGATARLLGARAASAAVLLAFALLPLGGCGGGPLGTRAPAAARANCRAARCPRSTRPRRSSCCRSRTRPASDLRLQSPNPLKDLARAVGDDFGTPPATVMDLLQQRAIAELQRRGFSVVPLDAVQSAIPVAPDDALAAVHAAARAGLGDFALHGTLRRFTVTNTGMLLVRLELSLLEARSEALVWRGAATRPVSIPAALTTQEIVLDAGGPIFAEAFAPR